MARWVGGVEVLHAASGQVGAILGQQARAGPVDGSQSQRNDRLRRVAVASPAAAHHLAESGRVPSEYMTEGSAA